jgi:RNA polymerase sigma-70 factor (ECF subfamily)
VRVRLHRARLFVRKELMKAWMPHHAKGRVASPDHTSLPSKPARCKALFAELSNYLDEQLDDSLCEELEKHMDGCEPCQAFLASLETTIEECRRAPAQTPDRATAAKLRRQVLSRYQAAMNRSGG